MEFINQLIDYLINCASLITNKQKQQHTSHKVRKPLQGLVVQSVVSLTSLLRVILLTVLTDLIHNILIFFAEKILHCKSYSHFFSKKFQHICVSLDVNFNESLTNDVVSFEQLGPEMYTQQRFSSACTFSPSHQNHHWAHFDRQILHNDW